MSKLSFRARALDPSKPMPIFLAEELPDLPEYSAINRAVPQMPSGMEKEEESEHHLQRAICTGLIIPTPEVFLTDQERYDRNYPANYKMPRQLIHMQPLGLEQDIPDYDMDSGDEIWVNTQGRRLNLTPLKFEQMMDRLEKSSGQTVVTLNEAKALLKEDDEVSIAVYDYWLNKRLKTQHPLILSVRTEHRSGTAANNPYLAFRRRTEKMQTRKNRKNDETSYEKMLKLRRDLSRAVTLLEMVKRREKTKREQLHLSIEIFEKRYQLRDFNGSLVSELSSNIKNARSAFAPLYPNQYSHHSSMAPSGILSSSSSGHHYSTTSSQYLNSTGGMVNSSISAGAIKRELDSGSRKEKRQYKKRKHKLQRDKQYSNMQSVSPAQIESTIESEEEDLAGTNLAGSEGEDEGLYAFRRNKNCEYHKPLTKECGNWPWESKEDNGLGDPKYRFTLTSIRHPSPRCIGFARRRVGRGGRVILDRISTSMDELWSKLDYTIFDSCNNNNSVNNKVNMKIVGDKESSMSLVNGKTEDKNDENLSLDSAYLSSSNEPILTSWYHKKNNINMKYSSSSSSCVLNNNLRNLLSSTESINNIHNYMVNKGIKREYTGRDDLEWTTKLTQQQPQESQPNLSQQSDIVIDLVRTPSNKNTNINNRNINNVNDVVRTINNNANCSNSNSSNNININDKTNVIKQENVSNGNAAATVIKEEPVTDILDEENMNLARLSSFINANKAATSSQCGNITIKSEILSKGEDVGSAQSSSIKCSILNNSNIANYINNCNKLSTNSNLPQDLCNVKNNINNNNEKLENDKRTYNITQLRSTESNNQQDGKQHSSTHNNNLLNKQADDIFKEFLEEIRKDWLHFRPKTPPKSPNLEELPVKEENQKDTKQSSEKTTEEHKTNEAATTQKDVKTVVEFSEQTPIFVEMQKLGSSPPSSVFSSNNIDDPLFITNPFSYSELLVDDQYINSLSLPDMRGDRGTPSSTDNSNSGIDFNLSGDSLNELNLSLGEEDNEKMLDNILQECQIDDIKTLNQTTNFWNGILDDGVMLDVIDEKKPSTNVTNTAQNGTNNSTDDKESRNIDAEFLMNGCDLPDEKDFNDKNLYNKKRKLSSPSQQNFGSSSFNISTLSKAEIFFRKESEIKPTTDVNNGIKTESTEQVTSVAPSTSLPTSSTTLTVQSQQIPQASSSQLSAISSLSVPLSSNIFQQQQSQQQHHHQQPTLQIQSRHNLQGISISSPQLSISSASLVSVSTAPATISQTTTISSASILPNNNTSNNNVSIDNTSSPTIMNLVGGAQVGIVPTTMAAIISQHQQQNISTGNLITASGSNQATIIGNLNTNTAPKIYIKQDSNQIIPTSIINQTTIPQNAVITLANIKLENDLSSGTTVIGGAGNNGANTGNIGVSSSTMSLATPGAHLTSSPRVAPIVTSSSLSLSNTNAMDNGSLILGHAGNINNSGAGTLHANETNVVFTTTGNNNSNGSITAVTVNPSIPITLTAAKQQQLQQHQLHHQQQQQSHPQQQHILLQQITPNSQTQIINVSNATGGITMNDVTGNTIVLAGTSPTKRQINGPTDRNAIQNILKQTKLINRKFHISPQQALQLKQQQLHHQQQQAAAAAAAAAQQTQDDDNGNSKITTITMNQQKDMPQTSTAGSNFIKMSTYPVVVSDLNVQQQQQQSQQQQQQQNSISTSTAAFAVTANHNYSLPTSAQQITIIGQQQQGNKIILNTSGATGTVTAGGNLTIPIQELQNKIHYNQIPTSNIKVNLVTSSGIQQGSLVVDAKNSEIVKAAAAVVQHQQQSGGHHSGGGITTITAAQQQQHQQQQRIKVEKALNMYIDQDQKRVLYTKFINLASLQNKTSGQTVQVIPSTGQILNKAHAATAQRLTAANAQAIVTNMRSLPVVSNQVVASAAGGSVNTIVSASSGDIINIGLKQHQHQHQHQHQQQQQHQHQHQHQIQHQQQQQQQNNLSGTSSGITDQQQLSTAATVVTGGLNLNTTNR